MNELKKDGRSLKIKTVDGLFGFLYKSQFLRERLKLVAERAIIKHQGYKFSYMGNENGEVEFVYKLAQLYSNEKFRF